MSFSLLSLFDERSPCVAVTGAGGKTTLLHALARSLNARGQAVLTATTTHMLDPHHPDSALRSEGLILTGNRPTADVAEDVARMFRSGVRHLTLGRSLEPGRHAPGPKLRGLEPDELCALRERLTGEGVEGAMLVEADGAARLPLKAHAGHEPAIPPCADAVVAVAGLDALGRPLGQVVHRPEIAAALLGLGPDAVNAPVTPAMMAALLVHPQGPFRGGPERRAVLLNKADLPGGNRAAQAAAAAVHALAPALPCHAGGAASARTRLLL